jgi:hypothetical protein
MQIRDQRRDCRCDAMATYVVLCHSSVATRLD